MDMVSKTKKQVKYKQQAIVAIIQTAILGIWVNIYITMLIFLWNLVPKHGLLINIDILFSVP
jgi:hypothetical protein